eukprot:CAMPEP_0182909120 /NCGR_PEP_ID=MMETSP0034_2-20130328/35578_1 /TAXON_ID=156128 /ORGANISM="Nephroselmis pyriformis, Strain CCMP717" /LENGTH=421 /DNA_ID=CAMNT_0025045355 /DNA_START=63 /DNA_END=1325 /DNA_ORIENTATION=+
MSAQLVQASLNPYGDYSGDGVPAPDPQQAGEFGKANDLTDVGIRLGLDPLMDVELFWIVQEYLEAPLPDGWTLVRDPQGLQHFVNHVLRLDVLENPIEPRYKKLVELMKRSKETRTPMDETTVLELMDPVERVADVREMAEYMGIDYETEPHLLWIAKLCVLEALPDGWEETVAPDGTVLYLNIEGGFSTEEHPTDASFKALLSRERRKRHPYMTIMPQYYEYPPARFREDRDADGKPLRTPVIPNQGSWVDFFDVYGRRFWYDLATERVTMDYDEVRYMARVSTIQRVFRGFQVRKEIWELHTVAKKICVAWRTRKFRRILMVEQGKRSDAARCFQRMYATREARIVNSRECFKRLGERGQRLGRAARHNVCQGLMNTGYSFAAARNHVIVIQRCFRAFVLRTFMFGRRSLDEGAGSGEE